MGEVNHTFLANASVILGVIVIIICLYIDDIPDRNIIMWSIPAMLAVTYLSLFWLSYR
jgi:hypothetical protein